MSQFVLNTFEKSEYRSKEDVTTLPPYVLTYGSQNVLINSSNRISSRKGYILDGAAGGSTTEGIKASFNWSTIKGYERPMRAGGLIAGINGKLQWRYVASAGDKLNTVALTAGTPYWIDLVTGLTSVAYNFTTYYDTTEKIRDVLFVNGASEITEWNGAVAKVASNTATTLTKTGTTTWAQEGFYVGGTRLVRINGVDYAYTGGETTTTLTGLVGLPTLTDELVVQVPRVTLNSAMTGIGATFANSLISSLDNQVYVASATEGLVLVSKVNNYKDFSQSSPRVVGDGSNLPADGNIVAFVPQESEMYVSVGKDKWFRTVKETQQYQGSAATEIMKLERLKTTGGVGARSQAMATKIKNDVAYVSFEDDVNTIGRVENIQATPQIDHISDPIQLDVNGYDYTGASVGYSDDIMYVCIPAETIVRVYNMQDPNRFYWEAPQTIPISFITVIDGELYGHSSSGLTTFKLNEGYNDNGFPIVAIANFAFNTFGSRQDKKAFTRLYTEGYMSINTNPLTLNIQYDIACGEQKSYALAGNSQRFVCPTGNINPLGALSLGSAPLGSVISMTNPDDVPPKMRWIKKTPANYFYEVGVSYMTNQVDARWALLAYGTDVVQTKDVQNEITD